MTLDVMKVSFEKCFFEVVVCSVSRKNIDHNKVFRFSDPVKKQRLVSP